MKNQAKKAAKIRQQFNDVRGFSVLELLIVITMIAVVTAFALMRVVESQRAMRLSDSAREFTAYLEKARIDSIRRHAQTAAEMARITINNPTSYTVTIDLEGSGTPRSRTINLPQPGITFNLPSFPAIIQFNWRGRTVDAVTGLNVINPAPFNMIDASGHTATINVTGSGDPSVNSNINVSPVSTSAVSVNLRPKTTIP